MRTTLEENFTSFLGNMHVIDLSGPELANFYRTSHEAHRVHHFWVLVLRHVMEVSPPRPARGLPQLWVRIEREIPLVDGSKSTLLRLTREDAPHEPISRFFRVLFPAGAEICTFDGEQSLLERALLDVAATDLHVSGEAIKKRWQNRGSGTGYIASG